MEPPSSFVDIKEIYTAFRVCRTGRRETQTKYWPLCRRQYEKQVL